MKWFNPALLILTLLLLNSCGGSTPTAQGDIINWPSATVGKITIVSKQDANVVFASQDNVKSDSKLDPAFSNLAVPNDAQFSTLGFVCEPNYTLQSSLNPPNFSGVYGLGKYSHPDSGNPQVTKTGNLGLFNSDPTAKLKAGDQQAVWVYVKTDVTLEGEVKCTSGDAKVHNLIRQFSYNLNNQTQKTSLKAGWNLLINTVDKFVETEKDVVYKYSVVQALPSGIRWYYLP